MWHVVALVVLCLVVFSKALTGAFVWDDQSQIVRNPDIRHLSTIGHAFGTGLWSFRYSDSSGAGYYRPLQTVIYTVVYSVAGLSPFAFHLANLILHCLATLAIFVIALQLGAPPTLALLGAALFATHPVHTEAVSWIAGVGDVACGVFYFGSLIAFLKYLKSPKNKWIVLSVLSFAGALFSKEMAITLPAVLVLLLLFERAKDNSGRTVSPFVIVPYIAAIVVYGACASQRSDCCHRPQPSTTMQL
jgi:hypothetical protein